MGKRQLCTYMCEVMSSSGVVVGIYGTWCAAWDGFFVPCPLFLLCTQLLSSYVQPDDGYHYGRNM